MTLEQASNCSLAQLKLLYQAAERRRCESALLAVRVVHAAVGACMHKDNRSGLKSLVNELAKQL